MPRMWKKVIVSGHVIEVYDYEEPVFFGFKSKGGRKKEEPPEIEEDLSKYQSWNDLAGDKNAEYEEPPEGEPPEGEPPESRKKEYRKTAMYRARERLRRLILCNFNQHSKFVTLTFRDGEVDDVTSVEQTNPLFEKFIKRLKYYLKKKSGKNKAPDLKYATVVEFQDKNGRGAVHYHMICNLGWLPHEELAKLWGHGWVGINSLRAKMREDGKDVDNVGAYMIKYMIKDFNDDRLAGKKAYFTSRNLQKPKEYKGMEAEAFWHLRKMEEKEIVFTSNYESEHFGTVTYREYNLKRCTGDTALQNNNKK